MNRMIFGATALMLAIPATAQMHAPPVQVAPQPMVQRMIKTQTRDEAVAKVREHFARMDVNRDGFVAGEEMRSMRGQRMVERRGGGERRALRMRGGNSAAAFDRLDANRDGMISREEFGRAREIRQERRVAINRAPGTPGVRGEDRGLRRLHRMGGMGHGRMMRLADLDRDGRVSLQEATNSALQRFDRVDVNRDGRITPEERRQQREQRRAARANRAG